ncbi:nucleophile aminohydrolase [Circinella umbellata]|nr:nucleophile aminohydrolase [Circinella umbellata]
MPSDPFPFISRRSTVYGTDGMVACQHPIAAQIGAGILEKGGNAADAAIAVAAALNVVMPESTGIGGDASCLFYNSKTCKVTGLNGTGRAPAMLTLDYLRQKAGITGLTIPVESIYAAIVPGAAAAWVDTVELFGSGKMDLATLFQPAIELAENGFPVSFVVAKGWKKSESQLKKMGNGKSTMLIDGVRSPEEGEMMNLSDLAKTFRIVAEHGKNGFYKGPIADAIVNSIQSHGGLLTHEDLASHKSEIVEPISIDYHDYTLWEMPPNSQGVTALIALGIIRALEEEHGLDFSKIKHNSAEYLHLIIEAMRIAFADTRHYVTDPQVHSLAVPIEMLLSKSYLSQRAKLVNLKKRNNKLKKGYPEQDSNTVYFCVVDREGNACSFINSNYTSFGTCIVPDGWGFTIHNRGSGFVLIDDHPNCVGPKKRPNSTLIPPILTRKTSSGKHELDICFGIMGSFQQPQGHVQMLTSLLNYSVNPQHAVDIPRICICPPKSEQPDSHPMLRTFTDMNTSIVYVEKGIDPKTVKKLTAMGHTCYITEDRSIFGRAQVIRVYKDDRTGKRILAAGSDPRADGQAAPVVITSKL